MTMQTMPAAKLVVAFPVYNGARTLEGALQCIADQDCRDFRAIIVENGSTDETRQIAEAFCARDPRFQVIPNQKHLGVIDNFVHTIGLAASMGEYFCLRAADDKSSPDFLSRLLAALEADPTKMLAVGAAERISPEGRERLTPKPNIFGFAERIARGKPPGSLHFPSEWFYGVVRSRGGAEIMLRRWPELGTPWCAASYTIAEFVVRDMVAYVEGPAYHFYRGSSSPTLYTAKSLAERIRQRWRYTMGCFRVRKKLPPMSLWTTVLFFHMCWKDAKRKTGYKLFGFL
ncbi:glycosyltransferase family 2 protein [Zavarzinia sp.]|uniref:glycosyltransferase family 2 protein n=1 Tax=Zavarzinia sp. TaxID=2027920 RepID=UPI003567B09C